MYMLIGRFIRHLYQYCLNQHADLDQYFLPISGDFVIFLLKIKMLPTPTKYWQPHIIACLSTINIKKKKKKF